MNNSIIAKTQAYFTAFADKDLVALENMYDDQVELLDWEQTVSGKQQVLEANKGLFSTVELIQVEVNELHVAGDSVACEITIIINSDLNLKVVDLITWSSKGSILKIDAYKQ